MQIERWQGDARPERAAMQRRLEAEGYSVYAWTDSPGTTYAAVTYLIASKPRA